MEKVTLSSFSRLPFIRRISAGLLSAVLLFGIPSAKAAAITIPENVTVIEESAFEGVSAATEIVIPESVQNIHKNAFSNCSALVKLTVKGKNTILDNPAILNWNENLAIHAYKNTSAHTYAVNNSIAFADLGYRADLLRASLISYAERLLGTPYSSLDCVGFVSKCYRNALGISIQNTCVGIHQNTPAKNPTAIRITKISDLLPGDIMCWQDDNTQKYYCTHVGMYVGSGYDYKNRYHESGVFIESSSGYKSVRRNYIPPSGSSYYTRNFIGAWRIIV